MEGSPFPQEAICYRLLLLTIPQELQKPEHVFVPYKHPQTDSNSFGPNSSPLRGTWLCFGFVTTVIGVERRSSSGRTRKGLLGVFEDENYVSGRGKVAR